ncbi:MAG: sodium:alanine symporter family protein [Acidobacteria bacterium]|nr:sodium:alanine symporter family protein [Acidobacteriota bacterium]
MDSLMSVLQAISAVLWHDYVLFTLLGVGILFTLWSGFGQYRALTHGVAVIAGRYDRRDDPGAISHFQALSAALSATVGLGNIAGVAIAISLGGPGAVFWMWVTGFVGMALKMTEVTQAMLYRNLNDPDNPHGGAMWVAKKGFARFGPGWAKVGTAVGGLFCVTLLVSTVTGGNMFQAWNVADITREYFGVPILASGVVQMVLVGLVIIGGIKRIGSVAGKIVPFMCGFYILAGIYVIATNAAAVPEALRLVFYSAFNPTEAQGAFVGGVAGWAFLRGMQRALFSSESGQGSAPIAHSAARTDEPVSEGVVAGLEPFVDTLCVCTVTALVILLSGAWNRPVDVPFGVAGAPAVIAAGDGAWTLEPLALEAQAGEPWSAGDQVFAVVTGDRHEGRDSLRHRLTGEVALTPSGPRVQWASIASAAPVEVVSTGIYRAYKGATLTAKAFDRAVPGLGFLLVPAVAWLFALSTMISWSYYGEQGIIYLFGSRWVMPYRWVYCLLILAASSPLIRTEAELDVVSTLGTGVMLAVNIPIMLVFGAQAMRAYHAYMRRLDAGELEPPPSQALHPRRKGPRERHPG